MEQQHSNDQGQDMSFDDVAAQLADTRLRRILASYGEPAMLDAPPDMIKQLMVRLPDMPPTGAAAAARRARWMRAGKVVLLLSLVSLWLLGSWSIFIDSATPGRLFGDTANGPGYVLLLLVLIAKPLVHTLLSPGWLLLLASVVLFGSICWLWWRLVQQVPLAQPAGVGV